MKAVELEREASRRLPVLLSELLGLPSVPDVLPAHHDDGVDLDVDLGNRRLLFRVKTSSSPGSVAAAADQLARFGSDDPLRVLVVPFMSSAGAKAAGARTLNWIDLSGNASLRDEGLYVKVEGRPNLLPERGRPSSAFAPRSSRVARTLLLDPERWWLQKELVVRTALDPGRVSRVVRRLDDDELLERDGASFRPRDRGLLLDAWVDAYRFDHHDIVTGHLSGSGIELARDVHDGLAEAGIAHAFTGLPAAWAIDRFARFRLSTVYVEGDPRRAADALSLRGQKSGANVALVGPDDDGVLEGGRSIDGLPCVAPIQVYLDLRNLPERAVEAAEELRAGGLWRDAL